MPRLLSVDPGVKRLGFAIFDTETGELLNSGTYDLCPELTEKQFRKKRRNDYLAKLCSQLEMIVRAEILLDPKLLVVLEENDCVATEYIPPILAGFFWAFGVHQIKNIHPLGVNRFLGPVPGNTPAKRRLAKKKKTLELVQKTYPQVETYDEADAVLNFLYIRHKFPDWILG